MNRAHFAIVAAVAFAWLMLPAPARAACAALSFCSCTVSATPVSFGSYNPVGTANLDGTGEVTVDCTLLAALAGSYTVDFSTGASGSYAIRTMKNGATDLRYNLYTDAAHTQIWGNNTGGSSRITRTFSGLLSIQLSNTVYGRVFGSQNVSAGTYSDTIVVTVTY
jgi:spore coat protein U-like protein